MFLVGIFQWWYGPGWLRHWRRTIIGVQRTADFFSISLLLRTLFNPFRQISAANVQGEFPIRLQAFLDRLFSRAVGGVIRSFTIIIGIIAILVRLAWSVVSMTIWALLPAAPVVGLMLTFLGPTL